MILRYMLFGLKKPIYHCPNSGLKVVVQVYLPNHDSLSNIMSCRAKLISNAEVLFLSLLIYV